MLHVKSRTFTFTVTVINSKENGSFLLYCSSEEETISRLIWTNQHTLLYSISM